MKIKSFLLTALLCSASFSVLSATEITRAEASSYVHFKDISVSGLSTAEEATAEIQKRAEKLSADHFVIVRLTTPGDSSRWSANATLYKTQ